MYTTRLADIHSAVVVSVTLTNSDISFGLAFFCGLLFKYQAGATGLSELHLTFLGTRWQYQALT